MGQDDPQADPVAVAKEMVLRLLTAKARTRAELAEGLKRRGVPDDIATIALDRFTELGLINDESFAASWVEGQQRRMKSSRALRQELAIKGVDVETIDEALAEADPDAELDAALALARKRARATRGLAGPVRYRRMAGALARRGFSGDMTHRAVKQVLDEEGHALGEEGEDLPEG